MAGILFICYHVIFYAVIIIVLQLFYSFFKSLVGKDVVVELKNDLRWVFFFLFLFFLCISKSCFETLMIILRLIRTLSFLLTFTKVH